MPICPICKKEYPRLRNHHWFPKRLLVKIKKLSPDLYNFLISFVLKICRDCETEVHPENEWHDKYNELCKYNKEIRDRKKLDDDYIVKLRKNAQDLNKQIQILQQKLAQKEVEKNGTGEVARFNQILAGKNIRITELVKQNMNVKKIEQELNRYRQIVKNWNKNKNGVVKDIDGIKIKNNNTLKNSG